MATKLLWACIFFLAVGVTINFAQTKNCKEEIDRNFDCFKSCHNATWTTLQEKANLDDVEEDRSAEIQQLQILVQDLQDRIKKIEKGR